jgi:hypothetical protein
MPELVRRPLAFLLASVLAATLAGPGAARASTVTHASFSGGAGTAQVGSVLYARAGAELQLHVGTDAARCLAVSGAFAATASSPTDRTEWTLPFIAGPGTGLRQVAVTAWSDVAGPDCAGTAGDPATASFVLDNTGPTILPVRAPSPNAAGWNRGTTMLSWFVSDAGSGVASGAAPTGSTFVDETAGTDMFVTVGDRVGNAATGAVTVRLDRTPPSILAVAAPAPNPAGWNRAPVEVSFACADALSGVAACPPPATLGFDGADQSVSGTAADVAGNLAAPATASVSIDTTPPVLSGTPTTAPNAHGWYAGDVTIAWAASDGLSGLDGPAPADATITGEGAALTATATIADVAGNTTTAGSPVVRIDRTPPEVRLEGGPVDGATYAVGSVPPAPACVAEDGLSGIDGDCALEGYAATAGTHTLMATVRDRAGHVASIRTSYTVTAWTMTGFAAPVITGQALNVVKGGSTIPLKFEVWDGETELTSTDAIAGLTVQPVACWGLPSVVEVLGEPATEDSRLRYDDEAGQFVQTWRSPRTSGECYAVTVATRGGSSSTALFRTR